MNHRIADPLRWPFSPGFKNKVQDWKTGLIDGTLPTHFPMREPVILSRKFLSDTGGWKEMKEARAIHGAGRVSGPTFEKGVLEGNVKDQGKALKVRVVFNSRIDVENHCPCFRARRDGIICAHALAVGLEFIEPTERSGRSGQSGWGDEKSSPKPAANKPTPVSDNWPGITEQGDDDSIPATLHLVLPPKLPDVWAKGRINVGVEIDLDGDRRLLKSVDAATKLFFDSSDATLFRALQQISPEDVPGMMIINVDEFSTLLAAIPGHHGVSLGKRTPLKISHLPYRPALERGGNFKLRPVWAETVQPLIGGKNAWVLNGEDLLQPVAHGLASELLPVLISGLSLTASNFREAFVQLQRHFETSAIETAAPAFSVELKLEGSLNYLDAELSFAYGKKLIPAAKEREAVWEVDGVLQLADQRRENEAIAELESIGFEKRNKEGRFVLKDKNRILQFLAHGYPAFQQRWNIETGDRFAHALNQVEPIETAMDFRPGGEDWFAMEVGFATPSGNEIPRQEIERLLQMGQSSQQVKGGKIAVLNTRLADQLGEIINDCAPEQLQPGTYRIDQSQAGYLKETANDYGFSAKGAVPWQISDETVEFYDLSDSLEETLRPYQREGVNWMQSLASQGMGGILADDMGLGKTLQTLSFLYSVGGRSLVICPSSLVFNWVEEAAKFVPELKAVAIHGPNRAKTLEEHGDADIIVTSYALLRRDEAWYQEREFDVVILDEAQHIKNPEAQVSKAAHRLPGTYRFALTGTPIENSVRDLWSISQFALPGYLGRRQDFAERFEKPLSATDAPASVRERLHRRLRPVILRRLKSEVAKDLPEKLEQIIYCDLKPAQQEVYTKLLQESRTSLLEAEGGRKRMLALTALLRLRQTCCDLRLLGMQDIADNDASVKADALSELLDEAIEGGHRVLVFSQFVEMLQLIVPQLVEKQVDFCYLDGQTKNRGDVVNRFQTKDIPVFLISLKAGGVGLNLTGADTVIHVDPWWNPAVEAQATDRAHRIGQTRVVTSYKLITRNTVEEKILTLQNKKRAMMESLLADAGDASMNEGELMSLFQ